MMILVTIMPSEGLANFTHFPSKIAYHFGIPFPRKPLLSFPNTATLRHGAIASSPAKTIILPHQ
jgi:hypothetical protein